MPRGKLKQPAKYPAKICAFCGREFVPSGPRQQYCKGPHIRQCPVCGKDYIENNSENLKKSPVACSYECRKVLRERTSMKRYGIKTPGNNPEARKKARKTLQDHLGVDYAMQSPEVVAKSKNTIFQKYHVDNVGKSTEVINKRTRTAYSNQLLKSLPVDYDYDSLPLYDYSVKKMELKQALDALNLKYTTSYSELGMCVIVPASNTIFQFVSDCNLSGSAYQIEDFRNQKEYAHCQLVFLYPWMDMRLAARAACVKIPVYARRCKIYKLKQPAAKSFISRNLPELPWLHGCNEYFGLVYQNELVQVLACDYDNTSRCLDIFEIVSHTNYRTIGGMSRLISHAVSLVPATMIRTRPMTRVFGSLESWKEIGFEIKPNYRPMLYSSYDIQQNTWQLKFPQKGVVNTSLDRIYFRPIFSCASYIYSLNLDVNS